MNRPAPWTTMPGAKLREPRQRQRVNAISGTRRQTLLHYAKVKRMFMQEHKDCEFPECKRKATDVHHTRGRVGRLLCDVRFWAALCRQCHDWVGANPLKARELGLLCQPGEWNKPQRD